MESINLADAKARFSEIVDRAEAGESIEITRRGKLAARIVPPTTDQPRKPIDLEALRKLRESLPYQTQTAADLIREMRDEGY
ncbi:type II toxin-antitoxin system Phd/YefM family antitoxin [Sphingomonas sp. SUN039]|uniref:type II toxin-antitoxin system Phd/YefM family antitoxin n=1 Tax=Sphingomonas sp. SUN039 TaxID=2937787 RepID=UPI00216431C5|nr:type II toxin-antitoxin system prevent-host-death family antitoxin [Sphingomonas sp. SUN039]UVO52908.1 type II toxin-antitoxin system prevent-host-death family antitoxin [Sphingomonas sp. SUN039]